MQFVQNIGTIMQQAKQRNIPQAKDTLGETLYSLRLNGLVYANSELRAPWGMAMPAMTGKIMFHVVTQGCCWLRMAGDKVVRLNTGDLALLPKGEGHNISSDPSIEGEPFFNIPVEQISERFELIRYGGDGEQTQLTCGVLSFDHAVGQKLISQLPLLILMQSKDGQLPKTLQSMIQLMAEEASTLSAGGETVVAHLADIIVIKAIRYWIEHAPESSQGWLGALKDPKISKALAAMHTQPAYAWTVERLAAKAGMSRSGFSARFTEVIGTSAKQYLTEWRMQLARTKIMQSPVPLIELAETLGYSSEAAFSRAYKRVFGEPPLRKAFEKDVPE